MRKEATTTKPLFATGVEWMLWIERNCSKCWRKSRWDDSKNDWVNDKCTVDRDINQQLTGSMIVTVRSQKIVANKDCPNRQETRPEHTRKYTKRIKQDLKQD